MSSLNREVPVNRSRTMWIVQRSPSSSADREIGQLLAVGLHTAPCHSSVLELDDRAGEVFAESYQITERTEE